MQNRTITYSSVLGMMALAVGTAAAQPVPYVAVLQTARYVVGAANQPSGVFRYEGDTLWTHLGWTNVRAFGLDASPHDPRVLYIAGGNGVLRSPDGGRAWRVTTGWRITEVLDLALDPQQPGHLYAATAYGIWHSPDDGATWMPRHEGLRASFTQAVAADARRRGHVIAGTEQGLSRSMDGGRTWQAVGPDGVAIRELMQSRAVPNRWLAGTEVRGVLLSNDDGASWVPIDGALAGTTIYTLADDPAHPDRLLAAGYDTGVFLSLDGGRTWQQRRAGLPTGDIHALGFDPARPDRVWAGTVGHGLYVSDDLGRTWRYAGLRGAEVWDLIFVEAAS